MVKGSSGRKGNKGKARQMTIVPPLSSLIMSSTYLLMDVLDIKETQLDWLSKLVGIWKYDENYGLELFVKLMYVVNDPAECSIGMVQQYIDTCRDRQKLFLVMEEHRKLYDTKTKDNLSKICV